MLCKSQEQDYLNLTSQDQWDDSFFPLRVEEWRQGDSPKNRNNVQRKITNCFFFPSAVLPPINTTNINADPDARTYRYLCRSKKVDVFSIYPEQRNKRERPSRKRWDRKSFLYRGKCDKVPPIWRVRERERVGKRKYFNAGVLLFASQKCRCIHSLHSFGSNIHVGWVREWV